MSGVLVAADNRALSGGSPGDRPRSSGLVSLCVFVCVFRSVCVCGKGAGWGSYSRDAVRGREME